jgi:hypothetical protein
MVHNGKYDAKKAQDLTNFIKQMEKEKTLAIQQGLNAERINEIEDAILMAKNMISRIFDMPAPPGPLPP